MKPVRARGWRAHTGGGLIVGIALTVLALMAALPAEAQRGRGRDRVNVDWGDLRRPEYSSRYLDLMVDVLRLDHDQQLLIGIFLEEYDGGYRELRDEAEREIELVSEQFRLAREAGREIDRDAARRRLEQRLNAFRERHEQLSSDFNAGVQAVLFEEQRERWPELERTLRRRELLGRDEISGEDLDLFEIVDRIELSPEALDLIEPILADYSIQLDLALRAREGELPDDDDEDAIRDVVRDLFRGEADVNDMMDLARQQRVLRVRVRDTNLRFAGQIRDAIPDPDEAAEFDAAVKEEAFGRIYRETHTQRVLEAALLLEGLNDSTYESIESLIETFELRMEQFNRRLELLTLREEPRESEREAEEWLDRFNNGFRRDRDDDDEDDPLRRAFEERETFEANTIVQLHHLLTEEQIRALPREERRGRRGD